MRSAITDPEEIGRIWFSAGCEKVRYQRWPESLDCSPELTTRGAI